MKKNHFTSLPVWLAKYNDGWRRYKCSNHFTCVHAKKPKKRFYENERKIRGKTKIKFNDSLISKDNISSQHKSSRGRQLAYLAKDKTMKTCEEKTDDWTKERIKKRAVMDFTVVKNPVKRALWKKSAMGECTALHSYGATWKMFVGLPEKYFLFFCFFLATEKLERRHHVNKDQYKNQPHLTFLALNLIAQDF